MHKSLIALPLLSFCLLQGQPARAAGEEPVAEDAATAAEPYLAWHRELAGVMQGMAQCLAPVRDEAGATAAAPEMARHTAALRALLEREKELPPPSDGVQQYFRQNRLEAGQAEQLADAAFGRILELLFDQDPPCYGSAPLQEALREFMDLVRG